MKKQVVKKATIELQIYEDHSYDIKIVSAKYYDKKHNYWWDEIGSLFSDDIEDGFNSSGDSIEDGISNFDDIEDRFDSFDDDINETGFSCDDDIEILKNSPVMITPKMAGLSLKNNQILKVLEKLCANKDNDSIDNIKANLSKALTDSAKELKISRSSVADKITRKIGMTTNEFAEFSKDFIADVTNYKNTTLFKIIFEKSSLKDRKIIKQEYDKVFCK